MNLALVEPKGLGPKDVKGFFDMSQRLFEAMDDKRIHKRLSEEAMRDPRKVRGFLKKCEKANDLFIRKALQDRDGADALAIEYREIFSETLIQRLFNGDDVGVMGQDFASQVEDLVRRKGGVLADKILSRALLAGEIWLIPASGMFWMINFWTMRVQTLLFGTDLMQKALIQESVTALALMFQRNLARYGFDGQWIVQTLTMNMQEFYYDAEEDIGTIRTPGKLASKLTLSYAIEKGSRLHALSRREGWMSTLGHLSKEFFNGITSTAYTNAGDYNLMFRITWYLLVVLMGLMVIIGLTWVSKTRTRSYSSKNKAFMEDVLSKARSKPATDVDANINKALRNLGRRR
jgi:preprotein translocase subunit SecG